MNSDTQEKWIKNTLFFGVFWIFLLTSIATLIAFLSLLADHYIHTTAPRPGFPELPEFLKGLITINIMEVPITVFLFYKKIFNRIFNIKNPPTAHPLVPPEILDDRNIYISTIIKEIKKAHKEILFTSRTMAHSEQDKEQSHIIETCIKVNQEHSGNIVHKGIICARPETIRGAIDLKNKVPHIKIKFNTSLELIDISYFIVDRKRLIFGVGIEKTKQACSLESAGLSKIVEAHFNRLWVMSISMRSYIERTFKDACLEAGEDAALEKLGFPSKQAMQHWLERTLDDEKSQNHTDKKDNSPVRWTIRNTAFDALSTTISQYIKQNKLSDNDLETYRKLIHESAHINYEIHAPAFLYLYYVANYYKTRFSLETSLREVLAGEQFRALDLGCGSGASTLAIADWFSHSKNASSTLIIDAVDQCQKQLELHKEIIRNDLLEANIQINRILCDGLNHIKSCNKKYDLIVEGNFFCELEHEVRITLIKYISPTMKPNGLLLAIEQPNSDTYNDLDNAEHFYKKETRSLGPYDIPNSVQLSMPELSLPSKYTYTVGYGLYGTKQ